MDAFDIASLVMFIVFAPLGIWAAWFLGKQIIGAMIEAYRKYPKNKPVDYLIAILKAIGIGLTPIVFMVCMGLCSHYSDLQ